MSLITIAWSIAAAIGLTFFFIQISLWYANRDNPAYLLAGVMSLAAGLGALTELGMALAASPADFQTYILLNNLCVYFLLVPMVWFVRYRLQSGPRWLLWMITTAWTFCLVVNFVLPGNLTFESIERLDTDYTFWGEAYNLPVGTPNPFRFVSELATFLIIVFVVWATAGAFRKGERQKAFSVGVPILVFILAGGIHSPLVDSGIVKTPYMISWAFVAIAVSLGWQLVRDATAVVRYSRQVRQSEARWRILMENVEIGVIGTTAEGSISFANRYILDLLGLPSEGVLGRPMTDFVPVSVKTELAGRIAIARQIGPRPSADYPLVDALGQRYEVHWSLVGIRDETGEIVGFMAFCDDVTAVRKTEHDLQQTRRTIERLDRSAILYEVTAGVAHELNQPLAAILSNAQAGRRILDQVPPGMEEIGEIFADLVDDSKRAGAIIRSVRAMSSPKPLPTSRNSCENLVDDIERMVSTELQMRRVTFVVGDRHDLPDVVCNKVQIQQVILNLILNAANILTDSGHPSPRIELVLRARSGYLYVYVCDNGPGIREDIRNSILESGVTTREYGLGMGLAISNRIVETHSGKLAFRSRTGKGTVFRFTLPFESHES